MIQIDNIDESLDTVHTHTHGIFLKDNNTTNNVKKVNVVCHVNKYINYENYI